MKSLWPTCAFLQTVRKSQSVRKDQALPITILLHSLALSLLPPLSSSHFPADRIEHLFILANRLLRKSLEQSNARCLESARIWTRFDPAFKWDEGVGSPPCPPAPGQGLGSGGESLASPRLCLAPGRLESIVSAPAPGSWHEPAVCSRHTAILWRIRWSIRLAYKMLMAFSKPRTSPAQDQGN